VASRFQSLAFKFNLYRYSAARKMNEMTEARDHVNEVGFVTAVDSLDLW
jgi:hypothetical protein